jgi:hypothetical protein
MKAALEFAAISRGPIRLALLLLVVLGVALYADFRTVHLMHPITQARIDQRSDPIDRAALERLKQQDETELRWRKGIDLILITADIFLIATLAKKLKNPSRLLAKTENI